MALQLIPSESRYIWGKFDFLCHQCAEPIFSSFKGEDDKCFGVFKVKSLSLSDDRKKSKTTDETNIRDMQLQNQYQAKLNLATILITLRKQLFYIKKTLETCKVCPAVVKIVHYTYICRHTFAFLNSQEHSARKTVQTPDIFENCVVYCTVDLQ